MASTYVNNLRLEEIGTGEQSGTWGDTTNTNLKIIGQAAAWGQRAIANASTDNITIGDGALDADRCLGLKLTGGGQACAVTLLPLTSSKTWFIYNTTNSTLTFRAGSNTTSEQVAILAGETKVIATDGLGANSIVYDLLTAVNLAGVTKVDDLIVGDDLVVVDDASVGGILGVTGVLTTTAATVHTNGITMPDSAIAKFGTDTDMQIFHNGSSATIRNSTGSLVVRTDAFRVLNDANSEQILHGDADGAVTAYFNNAIKLATTNTGVDITGGFAATAASTISTADNLAQLTLISTDADNSAGPLLDLFRNSASPADGDVTGNIRFIGENDAGESTVFSDIINQTFDVSNGTEDGVMYIRTMAAGTLAYRITINSTETIFNDDSLDQNFRIESNDNANAFFIDGGTSTLGINRASDANVGLSVASTATSSSKYAFQATNASSATKFHVRSDGHSAFYKTGNAVGFLFNTNGAISTTPDAGGHFVINEDSVDVDFRVESNAKTHALFVDGGANMVLVGGGTNTAGGAMFKVAETSQNCEISLNASATATDLVSYARNSGAYHPFFVSASNMTFNPTGGSTVVFNENSADVDFRVETDGNAATLFVDGSGNNVCFGKNTGAVGTAGGVIGGGAMTLTLGSGNTYHLYDGSAYKFYVNANGGIYNYQSNNSNLSDQREKKNIVSTDAKWGAVKAWSVKEFHYNADEDSDAKKLGVIAQDVETNHPELITEFKTTEDATRKAVKEQQMMWMAIKALQEAQARIETLEAKVTALENA